MRAMQPVGLSQEAFLAGSNTCSQEQGISPTPAQSTSPSDSKLALTVCMHPHPVCLPRGNPMENSRVQALPTSQGETPLPPCFYSTRRKVFWGLIFPVFPIEAVPLGVNEYSLHQYLVRASGRNSFKREIDLLGGYRIKFQTYKMGGKVSECGFLNQHYPWVHRSFCV